jgi:hypothetical protein
VPSGGGDQDPFARPERGRVFDPVEAGLGEEVRVRLEGDQPGDVTGSTQGSGVRNLPLTSYSDRFAEYRSTALDSLERLSVPSALQQLVRDYFTRLEP